MSKCILCGNEAKLLNVNNMDFIFCSSCGLLKKIRIPDPTLEKERYQHHIIDDGYMKYMNKMYDSISPYLNDGLSLDFGCGQKNSLEMIFNEHNRKMLSYDKCFFESDYEKYKFDNIILIEVIEHIDDFMGVLNKLKGLLNPKGRIIINTGLHENNFDNWWYLRDITHISFFSKKTFEYISQKINMKIVKIDGNMIVLEL